MSILAKGSFLVHLAGAQTATTDVAGFVAPAKMKLVGVRAKALTGNTGADLLIDIHNGGTTIFTTQSNRVTIADGATEGAAGTIELPVLDEGDVITVDVDQVGSTVAGSDVFLTFAYEGAAL